MSFLEPSANGRFQNFDIVPSSASAFEVVQGRVLPIAEAESSYLQGTAVGANIADFDFPWPFSSTNAYGDGHFIVQDTITSLTLTARLSASPGTSSPTPVMFRNSVETLLGSTFSVTSSTPSNFSLTLTTDPATGLAWVPSNIGASTFGLSISVVLGAANLRVYTLYLDVLYLTPRGNSRARIGPLLSEPSLYCAICGFPRHIRELVKIEEPRHPHVGLWICREDVDTIDREPTSPELVEGDIDFDL